MAINLMELAQSYLSGPIIKQISGLLGESERTTQSAVSAAVPAVIGGLMQQASTPSGASGLSSTLDKLDTGFLGNLGSSLGGDNGQSLMQMGTGLVKNLFGGSFSSVTDALGKATGMGIGSIGSLLGIIGPIVMGVLAKQKKSMGLDAGGLTSLLSGQKSFISGLLPAGVADSLGLGSLVGAAKDAGRAALDTGRAAAATAGGAGAEAVRQGSSFAKTLIPILLIAVLGFIAWRMFSTKSDDGAQASTTSALDSAKRQLTGIVDSATAALTSVKDEASARAALPKLEEAAKSVSSFTASLQTMPQSVKDGVGKTVSNALPTLQSLADKVMAIPGVGPVLKPAVTQLTDGLVKLRT